MRLLAFSGLATRCYLQAATCTRLHVITAAGPDRLFSNLAPVTLLAGQIAGAE